jgi:hypothetical protein
MKKIVRFMAAVCFLITGTALVNADNIGYNVNINIGNEPEFIAPPSLGFYVAVGVPYDMFYVESNYYLHRDNGWFVASGYNGPWVAVHDNRRLPRGLRKYKYDRMIAIRDEEYGNFQRDRDHYKGKHRGPRKHDNQGERGEDRGEDGGHGQQGREHGNH